jgi:NTP pyrophosphatase (non-canonical NTP hydrolase)
MERDAEETEMNTVKNLQAMQYITNTLSEEDLLRQLAEESMELAHAALKAIRAYPDSDNPADVAPGEAYINILEEVVDVANAYTALTGDWCAMAHLSTMCRHSPKWKRWRKRVRKAQRKKRRNSRHDR